MSTQTKKPMVVKDLACETGRAMHAALRKCCDSKPTSLAWNLIYMLHNVWEYYTLEVTNLIIEGKEPKAAAMDAAASLDNIFLRKNAKRMKWLAKDNARHEIMTLLLVFELFSRQDWEGITAYMDDDFVSMLKKTLEENNTESE